MVSLTPYSYTFDEVDELLSVVVSEPIRQLGEISIP